MEKERKDGRKKERKSKSRRREHNKVMGSGVRNIKIREIEQEEASIDITKKKKRTKNRRRRGHKNMFKKPSKFTFDRNKSKRENRRKKRKRKKRTAEQSNEVVNIVIDEAGDGDNPDDSVLDGLNNKDKIQDQREFGKQVEKDKVKSKSIEDQYRLGNLSDCEKNEIYSEFSHPADPDIALRHRVTTPPINHCP